MSRIDEKLIKKVKKNIVKIGTCMHEIPARTDGDYTIGRENCTDLSHIFSWQQSFAVGEALWAYVDTGDKEFLNWAESLKEQYYNKVFKTPLDTMHDLGFLYSCYAVMLYNITHDEEYKEIGVRAADVLSKRIVPNVGYIKAWGRMDNQIPDYVTEELRKDTFFANSKGLAIVDSMMNIPLLFWASKVTGEPYYERAAIIHADVIRKYFIREDYSVRHAYRFSEELGIPLYEDNDCGYSVGSHWARGTGWAIYGFAIAYRYTKKKEYLETALKVLDKYMQECGGKVPVWDFRLPDGVEKNVDTSANAIVLCGVIELEKATPSKKLAEYKRQLRESLTEYIDYDEDVMGILKEGNGRHTYVVYGDYYLLESMMKEISDIEVW